ncbi:uncharacterized protein [Centruroides vittatus]|uniref:uncharacterized protein n=1 Tax=Centruroides vittatus TaxID=120091 RepID=UPI00350F5A40
MISAMPAVALRRERKRTKQPPSRNSSLTSLSKGRLPRYKRSTTQSISTINSLQESQSGPIYISRHRKTCYIEKEKLRILMYIGTIFLMTGLVLVFVGVGANVSTTHTIGLCFIGIGSLLCLIKVFCAESQSNFGRKTVMARDSANENLTPTSPVPEENDFGTDHMQSLPLSPTEESNVTSNQTNSLTPTSLNSIPETQVLINEDKEKF